MKEVTEKIGVKKAGQKAAGLGKTARRKTSKESSFPTEVEHERFA